VNGVVVDDTGRGGERHTGAPGIFSLCLFGLTIIVSLCSKDLVKGLSMAGIGLVLASIGIDPVGGIERLIFALLWSRRELPAGSSDLA
jgi:TctA family transporter